MHIVVICINNCRSAAAVVSGFLLRTCVTIIYSSFAQMGENCLDMHKRHCNFAEKISFSLAQGKQTLEKTCEQMYLPTYFVKQVQLPFIFQTIEKNCISVVLENNFPVGTFDACLNAATIEKVDVRPHQQVNEGTLAVVMT